MMLELPKLNFPETMPAMESKRLTFSLLEEKDAQALFALRSNTEAMQYLDRPKAKSIDDALAMIHSLKQSGLDKTAFQWGIFLKSSGNMIGTIGLYRIAADNAKTEIGYMFFPEYWRQGFASESMEVFLHFGFEYIGFHRMEADINPDNVASVQLCKKIGFQQEAHIRENFFFEGRFVDTVIMGMLKADWEDKQKRNSSHAEQ